MSSVAQNRATIDHCGYLRIADFVLPRSAWFESYFDPLEARISQLAAQYADDADTLRFLQGEREEIELVRRYGDTFGYVFYIAQRPLLGALARD